MADSLILCTIFLPWLGAVILWLTGDKYQKALPAIAVLFSALAAAAAVALIPYASAEIRLSVQYASPFGELTFRADGLAVLLVTIATVIGCLAVVFSIDYMRGEKQLARYYAFVLFFIGGMAGLVLTGSLMFLFLFWEITALCSYALISFHNDDPKAVKGGIKALIMTQVGGIGLLAGALVIYGQTGSFDINDFLAGHGTLPAGLLAFTAFSFLVAAAAKSAQFPFQTWLPDAMEAPTPISALIHAATMVNAGVYLLARFYPAFEAVPGWKTAVVTVGVVTALMAGLMGLVATDLKRVLAYSTVSQLGYMVYAIGAGGVYAAQFHLLSHAVFKALLFLSAGAVIHAAGTRDMRRMGGLGKQMPVVRAVFITGALALSGIPILNGFWSKELILEAGLGAGPAWAYGLMLAGAGLTALYTLRCTWMVFYSEPRSGIHAHDAGPAMRAALYPLALGTLTSWILAGGLIRKLGGTLPYHEIHSLSTIGMIEEVATAPATLLALAVVAAGILCWVFRSRLQPVVDRLRFLRSWADASFGFEAVNGWIVDRTNYLAEKLRNLQTGYLNWNLFAVMAGLLCILAILAAGAGYATK